MPHPSYVHGASDVPLIGATIAECFDRTVARFPDREALVVRHQDVRFTWAELKLACERLARGLLALGLRKGDRIGIWSPNWAEWVIAQFATPRNRSSRRSRPFSGRVALIFMGAVSK